MATAPSVSTDSTNVLYDIAWSTYLDLRDNPENYHLRMTYDEGILEIMSPSLRHGGYARFIDLIIGVWTEELNIPIRGLRDMTCKRADRKKGLEPDECYYVMVIPLTPPPPTSSIRAWRTIRGQSWNWRSDSIRKRSVERICSSFGGRRDFFVRVARTAAVGLRREAGSSATVVVTKRRPLRERSFRTRISPCGCGFGPFGT